MKKPFLHALGASVYIAIIVLIVFKVSTLPILQRADNILMPMTMLSLFVLSAAVMGFIFLSEPLKLFLENRKEEAVKFFAKTVGFFACFVILFAILILLV